MFMKYLVRVWQICPRYQELTKKYDFFFSEKHSDIEKADL